MKNGASLMETALTWVMGLRESVEDILLMQQKQLVAVEEETTIMWYLQTYTKLDGDLDQIQKSNYQNYACPIASTPSTMWSTTSIHSWASAVPLICQ